MEKKLPRTGAFCHKSDEESERRRGDSNNGRGGCYFVCAPYVPNDQGRYRPAEGITQCPWAEGRERCQLKKHDWRERKAGPCVPLRLMYCRSHGRHFTIYPIGHVPYSRRRVVPVDLAGHSVKSLEGNNQEPAALGARVGWEGSWFRGGSGCGLGAVAAP